ncbi:MAG: hypothetical protein MUE44_13765 [Oscillatoriaceae cyanobacterium Prado104]|nr:hypothetical protein [Oscillatoriaceae cyanobacterium Prado104]
MLSTTFTLYDSSNHLLFSTSSLLQGGAIALNLRYLCSLTIAVRSDFDV